MLGRRESNDDGDDSDVSLPDIPSIPPVPSLSQEKKKPTYHEISDSSDDESDCKQGHADGLVCKGSVEKTVSANIYSNQPSIDRQPVCLSSDDEKDTPVLQREKVTKNAFYSDGSDLDDDDDDNCAAPSSLFDRLGGNVDVMRMDSSVNPDHLPVAPKKRKMEQEETYSLGSKVDSSLESRQSKKAAADAVKAQKQLEKERKAKEREEKKQEKEREALKQRMLREARKNATPKECMKFVTMVVDPGLMKFPCGAALLSLVQETNLKYDVQSQVRPNVVTFWRETTDVKESETGKLHVETKEIVEDVLLLYMPVEEFVSLADALVQSWTGVAAHCEEVTLRSYVEGLQGLLENRDVTLIVQGIEKYYKGGAPKGLGRGKKQQSQGRPVISKQDVDMALVDIQLHTGCNIRLLETDQEVAKAIFQYAKAVAERPFKQERLQTGFNFHMETGNSVKIDKDGVGLTRVWRQQIQQFKNVSAEVANAIIAQYPTPRSLWNAYQTCASDKEADLLLQDILVRRGYGVMENSRRVGKELSRRIHKLFTSDDPDFILA